MARCQQVHYKKGKLWGNLSQEHRCKNLKQNISKSNPAIYKRDNVSYQVWFILAN